MADCGRIDAGKASSTSRGSWNNTPGCHGANLYLCNTNKTEDYYINENVHVARTQSGPNVVCVFTATAYCPCANGNNILYHKG